MLAWLNDVVPSEMREFGPTVAQNLAPQFAACEAEETTLLAEFEHHIEAIAAALGRESIESALTADALSRLCGRTLHDWNDVHSGRS